MAEANHLRKPATWAVLRGASTRALRQRGGAIATPTGAVLTRTVVTTVLVVVSITATESKKTSENCVAT